jgi:hypothetical protein
MLQRLVIGLCAAFAAATAASVLVIALAFALYAFLEVRFGAPLAGCGVALAAFLPIALAAVIMGRLARSKPRRMKTGEVIDSLIDLVREQPLEAIASALAAGFMAVRNPGYIGELLRGFFEAGRKGR